MSRVSAPFFAWWMTVCASMTAVMLGGLVMWGWIADIAWMRSVVPTYPPMMPNTALGLVALGVATSIDQTSRGRAASRFIRVCALFVIAAGAVTILEFLTGFDTGANHLLFHDQTSLLTTPVRARPWPLTSLCLAFFGLGLWRVRDGNPPSVQAAQLYALAAMLVSSSILIEYAFAAIPESRPVSGRGMSLPSALAFGLLSIARLTSRPGVGVSALILGKYEGSFLLRRLLPVIVFLPIALGVLGIWAEPRGISRQSLVASTLATIGILGVIAIWNGNRLNRLCVRREALLRRLVRARRRLEERVNSRTAELNETVESLRAGEERTRSIVENLAEAVVIYNDEGIIQTANSAALTVFGYEEDQLVGQNISMLLSTTDPHHLNVSPTFGARAARTGHGRRHDGTVFPIELSVGEFHWQGVRHFSGVVRDLTLKHQAEEALRRRGELQEQLAMVAETMPGVIYSLRIHPDGSATMPFATPTVETLYGYSAAVLASDFSPVVAKVHPDDFQVFRLGLDEALQRATDWQGRFRYFHPTRGERWIEGRASGQAEPDGSVLWHGFLIDITDRQRDESAKRDLERLARSVFDSLSSSVAVIDETGQILAVNRAWREAAPANSAATDVLEGANYLRACETSYGEERVYADAFARGIRDVLSGALEGFEAEYPCHSPDRRRWFVGRVSPFSGPGPRRAVISHQDITPLKVAEIGLRESEERFRTLADGISQFAWMSDPHGEIYWYNRRWYDYTGADPEDVTGRGWERYIHADHLGRILDSVTLCLASGEPWEDTYPMLSRSGEYRWFLSRAMPVRGVGGEVVRWFGTNTDVTEQKELEARLTENDRRKDLFLAMLGHELRNPLATIQVAGEVLGQGNGDSNRGQVSLAPSNWALDTIRTQVKHLSRLLDDLMDVSRITRGVIRIERGPVDVAALVTRTVDAFRPQVESRRLRIEEVGPVEGLKVDGDPIRLEQVLNNLLTNAVKYTPTGGVIRVRASRIKEEIEICVKDNGIGIDRLELPHVFEPFSQGARTLDRSEGGLGLGLTIAAELVRLHGGRIEANSDGPGQGSEFRVILPAAFPAPLPPPSREQIPATPTRVLIVDDNRELAQGLAHLLQALGHEVELAFDGPSGLQAVRTARPDIMLLDLGLPLVDGYEVARQLRADQEFAELRIVAISGYSQEEDRRRSAEVGIDDHLAKPVDLQTLLALIRKGHKPSHSNDNPTMSITV